METLGWYEEIARQVGGWPWCNGLRAQGHGDLRRQEDLREELLKEAAVALSLGNEWPDVSPHKEELAQLQVSKNM